MCYHNHGTRFPCFRKAGKAQNIIVRRNSKMKYGLWMFFVLILLSQGLCGAEPVEPIRCQGWSSGHLQGLASDGESIFWSFTSIVYKTDYTGKVLLKKEVPGHHGDLCCHDGKLYVTVSFRLAKPVGIREYDAFIYIYNASDLSLVKKYDISNSVTFGVDGIEWFKDKFYVGDDKGKCIDVNHNTILVFSPDFNLLERKEVPGLTMYGVQTITWSGGYFWLGNYIRNSDTPTLQLDENLNFVAWHRMSIAIGALPLPKSPEGNPRLLKAEQIVSPEKKQSAELIPVVLKDGALVQQ